MHALWTMISADLAHIGSPAALATFGQIILIDVMLAADNAIVIGALAAGFPPRTRHRIILIGIAAALGLRVAFALVATQLMRLTGMVFAGGLLLLWVAWKFWREISHASGEDDADPAVIPVPRSFAGAAWAVMLADVSMSIDNVLAVAGAARAHPGLLAIGLILSVALTGLAANVLARLVERHRWIAHIGLAVILYVAGRMIFDGIADPATGVGRLIHV